MKNLLYMIFVLFLSCKEAPVHKPVVPLRIIEHSVFQDKEKLQAELALAQQELGLQFNVINVSATDTTTILYWLDYWSSVYLTDTSFTDTINLHIVQDDSLLPMVGFARALLKPDLVVTYPKYYTDLYITHTGVYEHAITHELGHMYGLKHTFNDGTEWGSTDAEIRQLGADKYNLMSYNPHTYKLTDAQREIILRWHHLRSRHPP